MKPRLQRRAGRAFSLVEVVIAVGILAAAIVAIMALLAPPLRATREVLDSTVAARLADGVEMEIGRLGFDSASGLLTDPGYIVVYATADGSRVVVHGSRKNGPTLAPPGIAAEARYFVLFIDELNAPAATDAFVGLGVRVEWPYHTPDGDPDALPVSAPDRRTSFTFSAALLR